jgi:hypothetical protein
MRLLKSSVRCAVEIVSGNMKNRAHTGILIGSFLLHRGQGIAKPGKPAVARRRVLSD